MHATRYDYANVGDVWQMQIAIAAPTNAIPRTSPLPGIRIPLNIKPL